MSCGHYPYIIHESWQGRVHNTFRTLRNRGGQAHYEPWGSLTWPPPGMNQSPTEIPCSPNSDSPNIDFRPKPSAWFSLMYIASLIWSKSSRSPNPSNGTVGLHICRVWNICIYPAQLAHVHGDYHRSAVSSWLHSLASLRSASIFSGHGRVLLALLVPFGSIQDWFHSVRFH